MTEISTLPAAAREPLPTSGVLQHLRHHGYVVIPDVLMPTQVAAMRAAADEIERLEGPTAGGIRQSAWQLAPAPDALAWRRAAHALHCFAFKRLRRLAWHVLGRKPALRERLHGWTTQARPQALIGGVVGYVREAFYTEACSEAGALRLCNLINKHHAFDICLEHPAVLAAVRDVIGHEVKVSSLNYRAAEPGGGLQPLHIDGVEQPPPARVAACNTLWLLDDLTPTNGATRVVPGSHTWGMVPPGDAQARRAPHPAEVTVHARAGSVIVVHGHVWHGGTLNRTTQRRRLVQGYFVGASICPQMEQEPFVTPATRARLSASARSLLAPRLDEYVRQAR